MFKSNNKTNQDVKVHLKTNINTELKPKAKKNVLAASSTSTKDYKPKAKPAKNKEAPNKPPSKRKANTKEKKSGDKRDLTGKSITKLAHYNKYKLICQVKGFNASVVGNRLTCHEHQPLNRKYNQYNSKIISKKKVHSLCHTQEVVYKKGKKYRGGESLI